jgi:hypothetical protein
LRNLENATENSLSQGTGPSEAVEIHVSEAIPEIQVIEPRELHVGESPIQYQRAPGHAWDSQNELPGGYGSTRVVLMVRDPYWIHAYWEIAEDISDMVTMALGPEGWLASRKALRVHDVTDIEFDGNNSHRSVNIDIGEHATNWYINVDRPNRSYCAELGLIGHDGRFVCLSRSNTVRTPRAGVSEVIDEEWMTSHREREPVDSQLIQLKVVIIRHIATDDRNATKSARSPAISECLVFFIPTAPKYTVMT